MFKVLKKSDFQQFVDFLNFNVSSSHDFNNQ